MVWIELLIFLVITAYAKANYQKEKMTTKDFFLNIGIMIISIFLLLHIIPQLGTILGNTLSNTITNNIQK